MPPLKKIKGRYEIKGILGEGGMGVVYRAYDPPPVNRDVALKTLLEFSDRMSLQLFYKEIEVLKSMSHPNIVEIFDIGEFEENGARKPFFVMPLLPGQPLDVLIREYSNRLTVERVVDIMTQTCRGLQAAHDRNLIHRDLKPSNLFIMHDDSVKIIDFGVAHNIDARSRSSGFQKGTLLYMAPEQVQYKPLSAQSDIFSLGVVCYEALTRRQPFRGSTETEVVDAIVKSIPPPASQINPAVSPVISRVIHKAMAKQAWNRFDSAREFGETLQKALRNEPIELFDPTRIQPRIQRAAKALESGDYQFAGEIVSELEAEGNIDPQLTLLRTQIDQVLRQRTIAQLLEGARARFEEEEDPLALQKIQEVLQLDPNNVAALGLKSRIEERRSDKQIEKWLKLAQQHMHNHAYVHAREALQNVTQLRAKEPRALRMLADLEDEESEYLRIRQRKVQAYQSALNSWKNGEISEALSHMGLVLELDRRAPDTSSPETGATYQSFYNQVRSEHDAINNGYTQAQRALAERDCATAMKICQEYLAKYPNHALFQAFQVEIQEQQRQQLSAYIAEIDRNLDAEADLDAKIHVLRDALAKYPGEAHFERALRIVTDKRDLVNSIVARARAHESNSQITEAIADLEILRTIYAPYPGLQFEIDRLQKKRDQIARDTAKASCMEQVDRQLETGNYARALELLEKVGEDFHGDPEITELQKVATRGLERAREAEEMLSHGTQLCQQGQYDEGIDVLREARRTDDRNPAVRTALRDNLIERAHTLLESDRDKAELLISEAFELDPSHALVRSLQARIQDGKRDENISACLSQVRRLQASGDLEGASVSIQQALLNYPSEPRLMTLRDSVRKELAQVERQQGRLHDLQQARGLQEKSVACGTDELPSVFERSRDYARRYPDDPELQSIALAVEKVVRERGGGQPPTPPKKTREGKGPTLGGRLKALATGIVKNRALAWTLAGFVALVLFAITWKLVPKPVPPIVASGGTVGVQINTTPVGATIRVNGETRGTSNLRLALAPGDYNVEAELSGYQVGKQTFTVKVGSSPNIDLVLAPSASPIRIQASDLEGGKVQVDGADAGTVESGSVTLANLSSGDHSVTINGPQSGEDAAFQLHIAPPAAPSVNSGLQAHQLQLVIVTSGSGAAQVQSTISGATVAVDGQPVGQLGSDGLSISNLAAGTHELTIGQGTSQRKMSFQATVAPAVDAAVFTDRDIGSILVQTGVDDAEVSIDSRPPRKTRGGQLRIPGLRTTQHVIRVRKDGFRDPVDQTAAVSKGQETVVRFVLEPLPKLSSLVLERLPAGARIQLDGFLIGQVGEDGTLRYENIPAGDHIISVFATGYTSKSLHEHFSAGESLRISKDDLGWKQAEGTLEIIATASVTYTIQQDGRVLRHLGGLQRLNLEEGTYSIIPDTAGFSAMTVTIAGGQMQQVTLHREQTVSRSMERFHYPEQWTLQNGWYVHHGGRVLYEATGPGTYVFSLRVHFSHPAFSHPSRARWVIGFVNEGNYTQMELDNKSVYRFDHLDGSTHELPKRRHNIPEDVQSITISIDISPSGVQQRYTLDGSHWEDLYSWSISAPSLQNKRLSYVDGKFGFIAAGDHDIEIANFKYLSH